MTVTMEFSCRWIVVVGIIVKYEGKNVQFYALSQFMYMNRVIFFYYFVLMYQRHAFEII